MTREEKLKLYDEAVKLAGAFERKGKTMPYTSANGYMFSMLNKADEFGIRFSKEDEKRLAEEFGTGEFRSHGSVVRGYVRIPDEKLKDTNAIAELLVVAHQHVLSLPPK